jgi:hypothetical protein
MLAPKPAPGAVANGDGTGNDDGVDDGDAAAAAAERKRQEASRTLEQMRTDLEAHREAMLQADLTADERDLRQLDVKHANELAKLKANSLATHEDLMALEAVQAEERANLIEAQGEERLGVYSEIADKIRRATMDAAALELEDELKKWDDLILIAQQYGLDTSALEEARQKALDAIRQRWRDKENADGEEDADRLDQLRRQKLQRMTQQFQLYGQFAAGVGQLFDVLRQRAEQEADADGVRTAQEMQRIDALERKRRAAALVQIATSSAAAVAQAVYQAQSIPFPGNIAAIAAGVGAVLAGIAQAYALLGNAGSSQTATSTGAGAGSGPSTMPMGAKGGIFDGPSHDNGGLQVWDPSTGRQVAEVEGGEPWMVLSKAFRRNNAGLIPTLLNASATGARVDLGARGGIFAPAPRFNFTAANEAVKLAAGGVLTRGTALVNAPTNPSDNGSGALLEELRALRMESNRQSEILANWPTSVKAVASVQDMNRRQAELVELQDRNRVGRVRRVEGGTA